MRRLIWEHDWQSDVEYQRYFDAARLQAALTSAFTNLARRVRLAQRGPGVAKVRPR